MPTQTISHDLKARIPVLRYVEGLDVKTICRLLGIKKTTVYVALHYHRRYDLPYNPFAQKGGRKQVLSSAAVCFIRKTLEDHPLLYLDEIQTHIFKAHHTFVSISTISRVLRRMHFGKKTVTREAAERNDLLRAVFMNRIGMLVPDPGMLMFTDESAKDERTSQRRRGWAPLGERCVVRQCFVRGKRWSIIPLLTLDGIITWKTVEGSVTAEKFMDFLREFVVSALLSFIFQL